MSRRFGLPAHKAVEFLAGMAMMLAPAIFAFGAGALIISASLGAILTGMGLSLSTSGPSGTLTWHRHFDEIFLLTTAVAAFGLALGGQAAAGVFLAAIVGILATLNLATAYSSRI